MYTPYIVASYSLTFILLFILALASLRGWVTARRDVAAFTETDAADKTGAA